MSGHPDLAGRPRTMTLSSVADAVYAALASLRAAVAILAGLAGVCAMAIAYEAANGTAAVQRDVYRSTWFAALLALLGLNIACSVTRRYPWTRHQIGFVLAHAGILLILIGSLVSLHFGADGSITLVRGESTSRMEVPERSIQVMVPGHPADVFPLTFDSDQPAVLRFALPGGHALIAEFAGNSPPEAVVRICSEASKRCAPSTSIPWTEIRTIALETGDVRIAFRPPELSMPFRVTLVGARVGRYPGSTLPSSYESVLQVDDDERGASEHWVTMNRPLRFRGYTFFLASMQGLDAQSATFSVAVSPGLPVVYAGSVLVTAGVAWMFYLAPRLRRRDTPARAPQDGERVICA